MKLLATIILLLVLKPTAVTATADAKAAVATLKAAPSRSVSIFPNIVSSVRTEIELWNRSSRQRQTNRRRGNNVSNGSNSSILMILLLCCCHASPLRGGDEFIPFKPRVNSVTHDAFVDDRKATWKFRGGNGRGPSLQATVGRIRGGDDSDGGAVTSSVDNEEEDEDDDDDAADTTRGEEATTASDDAIKAVDLTNGSEKAKAKTTVNDVLDGSTSTENSDGHSTEALSLDHRRPKASSFAPPTSSSSNNRPSLPPLYRFLLRHEGGGAHILLTIVVWSVEWIRLYLPLLASLGLYLVRWISLKLFGHDGTSSSSSSSNGSSRRGIFGKKTKPPSRREQKQLEAERVRQADLVAYQQLMQLQKQSSGGSNGQMSSKHNKYRHVSWDFIRRHGLGISAASSSAVATTEAAVSSVLSSKMSVTNMPKTSATDSASSHSSVASNSKRQHSGEVEIDWMVNALSTPSTKNSPSSKRNSKRTAKKVDAIVNALQTAQQQQLEEEDNDDDISLSAAASAVGNAASGLLSRSRLLGAYPGDTPSIDDAANPAVLEALAEERYGYGDWDDDDDDEDDDDVDKDEVGGDDVKGVNDFEDEPSPRSNRPTSKRPRATPKRTKPPNSQTNMSYGAKATAPQQTHGGDSGDIVVDSNETRRRRRRARRRTSPALSVKFEFHSAPSATASTTSREAPSRHASSSTRTQPTMPSKQSAASKQSTHEDEPKSSTAQSNWMHTRDRSSSILDTLKSSQTSKASLSDLISPRPALRSTDPPLSLSSILNNRINSETTTTTSPSLPQESTTSIRPALQLLNERRQQLQRQLDQKVNPNDDS